MGNYTQGVWRKTYVGKYSSPEGRTIIENEFGDVICEYLTIDDAKLIAQSPIRDQLLRDIITEIKNGHGEYNLSVATMERIDNTLKETQ